MLPKGPRCLWALVLIAGSFAAVNAADSNPLSPKRLDEISARYLGKPYVLDSLGEAKGPDKDPVYDASRVDCQTLVEQVMVDALAEKLGGRDAAIRLIRYGNREVAFENRCHFCLPDWLLRQWPAVSATEEVGGQTLEKSKRRIDRPKFLREKGGDPAKFRIKASTFYFDYIPREAVPGILKRVPDGSIAVFVHSRPDLVAAHMGLAFQRTSGVVLRHASQTRKKVIDEPLTTYLKRAPKHMIGMMFLKPDVSRMVAR